MDSSFLALLCGQRDRDGEQQLVQFLNYRISAYSRGYGGLDKTAPAVYTELADKI